MNRPNTRFGKWLHFVDTANSKEDLFPSAGCESIEVTNANTLILYFEHSGDNPAHFVTMTATGAASSVAAIMADYVWGSNTGKASTYKFEVATGRLQDVSVITNTPSA
tara:strand:+ start:343 stop:666 length:324 start_codon:yes stop_codon:yes gene_type:complete